MTEFSAPTTAVFEPMVGENYDAVQADAVSYLETFYHSKVDTTDELISSVDSHAFGAAG